MWRTMKLIVEIHCTVSVAILPWKKPKRMREISTKICIFFFFCCEMKAFHHDVLPRFVLNKFKVFFAFQNSVKYIAIDSETHIFSNNSYLEPVCLRSANLPISHFPISFLSVFALLCKCSSKPAWPLTLAFWWLGL